MASIKQRLAGLEKQTPSFDRAEAIKTARMARLRGDVISPKLSNNDLKQAAESGSTLAKRILAARERMMNRVKSKWWQQCAMKK